MKSHGEHQHVTFYFGESIKFYLFLRAYFCFIDIDKVIQGLDSSSIVLFDKAIDLYDFKILKITFYYVIKIQ